jgi:hypothetical protein
MNGEEEARGRRGDPGVDEVIAFLGRSLAAAAREEIEMPHIVLCTDPETGTTSYSGPYPNGLAALAAADRDERREVATGVEEPMRYSVAALLAVEGGDHE